MDKKHFVNADREMAAQFLNSAPSGPLIMIQLLKFRDVADYSGSSKSEPLKPVSGLWAFEHFLKTAIPLMIKAEGQFIYYGAAYPFLIGPADEAWDRVLILKQKSAEALLALGQSAEFQSISVHRTAALIDSRLLPTQELTFSIKSAI